MPDYDDDYCDAAAEAEAADWGRFCEAEEWRQCLSDLLDAYLKLHKNFKGLPEQEPVVIRARQQLEKY